MRDCNNKFMRNDMFMMFSRRTCFVLGLHVVGYSKLYKSDKKKLGHFQLIGNWRKWVLYTDDYYSLWDIAHD